jgi:peptidoglycan/LPS O-acetylase OafA/YrhL
MERGGQKLLYLESLRGIAALIVVFTHFTGSFLPAAAGGAKFPLHSPIDLLLYSTPLSIFVGGNFSVCIFFVLSSFVLTRGFFMTGNRELLTNGAFKRYFRLMPAVALSVLIAYVLLKFGFFFNQQAAALSGSTGLGELWLFPAHLKAALSQAFYGAFVTTMPGGQSYNPVLWTMQVEFLGSFLVFGMAALLGKHPKRGWIYVIMVIATWHSYFLGFALGLMLADATCTEWFKRFISRMRWSGWFGTLLIGLILGGYPSSGSTSETLYRAFPNLLGSPIEAIAIYHTLGALLVVMAVLGWTRLQHALNWQPFVILGKQSFGLYLTHFIVIATFSSYLFKTLMISHSYSFSFTIMVVVSLPLIFSVSYLYTRWVDQPSIAWSRYMLNGPGLTLFRKKPSPAQTAPKSQPSPAPAP